MLQNLFQGHLRRKTFLMQYIASWLVIIFIGIFYLVIIPIPYVLDIVVAIFIFVYIYQFSLFTRRLLDTGKSPYLAILILILPMQILLFFYLLFTPSKTATGLDANWSMKNILAFLLSSIVAILLVLYVWPGLFIAEHWGGGGGDAVHYYLRYERYIGVSTAYVGRIVESLDEKLSCELSISASSRNYCIRRRASEQNNPEICFELPSRWDIRECVIPLTNTERECVIYMQRIANEPFKGRLLDEIHYEISRCIMAQKERRTYLKMK